MMLTLAALFLAVPDTSLTDRVAKLEAMFADLASKHADLNSKYERALERIAQQEHTIRSQQSPNNNTPTSDARRRLSAATAEIELATRRLT